MIKTMQWGKTIKAGKQRDCQPHSRLRDCTTIVTCSIENLPRTRASDLFTKLFYQSLEKDLKSSFPRCVLTSLFWGFYIFKSEKKNRKKILKRIEITKKVSAGNGFVHPHQGSGCFSRFLILRVLISSFQHFVLEFSVFYFRVLGVSISFSSSANSVHCEWFRIVH